ncbi:MAG: right-handed parallel beta-helix repeat-containing protein [Bacteroidales bacterium]
MKSLSILPLLLLAASCSLMPAKKIYVAIDGNDLNSGSKSQPLQSMEAAKEAVRKLHMESPARDIRVILGEGAWYEARPLVLSAADGGTGRNTVIWEGSAGGKTILSGGKPITGFKDAGYGIWWANIDTAVSFEQLYVDGIRAVRARTPNLTDSLPRFFLEKSRWVYNTDSSVRNITVAIQDRGCFSNLIPTGEFEMVVFKDWTTSRFRATGLASSPAEIFLKPPFALFDGSYNSIFAGNANRYSCFLEGDPAFLDQPGEWALDHKAGRVYYKPLPGQMPEKTQIIAALMPQLIQLKGDRLQPIQNLEFRKINFQDCAYLLPVYSHDGMQAAFYYQGNTAETGVAGVMAPAIGMEWAINCRIIDCAVSHAGANGIYLKEGCRGNLIQGLVARDIGGNGVMIGLTYDPLKDSLLLPRGNTVTRCDISLTGVAFQGSVGIWLGFGAENEVSSSEIYDMPYTGISVGWQWNPLPTSSHGNHILNNKIHHVMQMLGDGGGIYTLGYQPGSIISGNDIHDILRSELNHASPNNGMFIDEGSKGYLVENNTIRNTAHTCIRGHRAAGVELKGNTFYSADLPAISHTPPYEAMIYANKDTTISWANPGWPKEWGYAERVTAFTMKGNRFLKEEGGI